MKNYELLTILKPNLDTEEVDKVVEKLNSDIAEMGGSVISSDKNGRKKLAFDADNRSRGRSKSRFGNLIRFNLQ